MVSASCSPSATAPPPPEHTVEDVRATDEELEALQAELASVRAASASTSTPTVDDRAWRGPPGLTHPEEEAEQRLSCSFNLQHVVKFRDFIVIIWRLIVINSDYIMINSDLRVIDSDLIVDISDFIVINR